MWERTGRQEVQVGSERSTPFQTTGARLQNTLKVQRCLRSDELHTGTIPYNNQPAPRDLCCPCSQSVSSLPLILKRGGIYSTILTSSPMRPAIPAVKWPEVYTVWQSSRAWPPDIRISSYEVDKQVPKLNVHYDPNLIFKILLKNINIHIYTQIHK